MQDPFTVAFEAISLFTIAYTLTALVVHLHHLDQQKYQQLTLSPEALAALPPAPATSELEPVEDSAQQRVQGRNAGKKGLRKGRLTKKEMMLLQSWYLKVFLRKSPQVETSLGDFFLEMVVLDYTDLSIFVVLLGRVIHVSPTAWGMSLTAPAPLNWLGAVNLDAWQWTDYWWQPVALLFHKVYLHQAAWFTLV